LSEDVHANVEHSSDAPDQVEGKLAKPAPLDHPDDPACDAGIGRDIRLAPPESNPQDTKLATETPIVHAEQHGRERLPPTYPAEASRDR
jgi:hypothetical protein